MVYVCCQYTRFDVSGKLLFPIRNGGQGRDNKGCFGTFQRNYQFEWIPIFAVSNTEISRLRKCFSINQCVTHMCKTANGLSKTHLLSVITSRGVTSSASIPPLDSGGLVLVS